MSDVLPNYDLERQGLELERAQLQLNIQSQLYRIAQATDEIQRIKVNIAASQKAISDLTDQINNLKET
jgi:septal ring factor EnvC (AmiA/AmiB activator)